VVILLINTEPIQTNDKIISVSGKVFYNDRRRRIDIKKPIRDLFESTNAEIGYVMELCLSEKKMSERIKELSGNNIIPVILYFTKEENKNEQMS
jgi:hypothetical protein